jgi:hypothetical protein
MLCWHYKTVHFSRLPSSAPVSANDKMQQSLSCKMQGRIEARR